MIKAEVIADSKNEFGNRITTFVVTFPRIILAEFNTHRMFSRNSASSRAIPFEKMVKSVEENPFIPIAWQKDHKGMQGVEYLGESDTLWARDRWLNAKDLAIKNAKLLSTSKITKQLCNRLLEPFMWHTVIVTATEWENFFALRCPKYYHYAGKNSELRYRSRKDALNHWELLKDTLVEYEKIKDWSEVDWLKMNEGQAEIHMMALAEAMWDVYNESTPKQLKAGEWHIPYQEEITDEFKTFCFSAYAIRAPIGCLKDEPVTIINQIKIGTTKAARTSYTIIGEDLKPLGFERLCTIHDEMLAANPKHMSPFEHCARAMGNNDRYRPSENWSGNFRGFIQYRKMIPNENITK